MRSSDITLSIFIILIFVAMYFYNILAVGIKNIQDNWPEYRCNPSIMPFAGTFGHDVMDNFTFCIQNMQTDFMGYLLQPLNYLTSVIGSVSGDLTAAIQDIRSFTNVFRDLISSIVQSIFGVFLNILTQFSISLKLLMPVEMNVNLFSFAISFIKLVLVSIADATLLYLRLNFLKNI